MLAAEHLTPREAPITSPLTGGVKDPTHPPVPDEPVLNVAGIQGNILAGFNKDHQTLLFLRIHRASDFRVWLGQLVPFVATTAEVLAFNRLFKEIRRRRGRETGTVQATWLNVALSFHALQQLTRSDAALERAAQEFPLWKDVPLDRLRAEAFTDAAFREGLSKRAVPVLSDPQDHAAEGHPRNWVFGGPDQEADVVIVLAGDDPADLAAEVARVEETIYAGHSQNGKRLNSGVHVLYKQQGATLPAPLTGHEHFGFLDGVSQPGVRGRVSSDESDVLTPRQNPLEAGQGKPGQDLLWPGEFVFGYPGQDPQATEAQGGIAKKGPDSLSPLGTPVAPVWARDGSFFVVRRLRQDVAGFHAFLEAQGAGLGIRADLLGAKLVGRWKSGAPILRAPLRDNPLLADDDCANNHFEFGGPSKPIPASGAPGDGLCSDATFPPSPGDVLGAICPFAGHIRKTYPRADQGTLSTQIGEVTTQTHRLLRRGIPFGAPFFPTADIIKHPDNGERGLVFAAYQTSIEEQFEFVQAQWANNLNFKDTTAPGSPVVAGHDLIIGQSNAGGSRERRARVTLPNPDGTTREVEVTAPTDWVVPTGGGYFFAPSIDALRFLTGS